MEVTLVLTDRGLRLADETILSVPQTPIEATPQYIAYLIKRQHPTPHKIERIAELKRLIQRNGDRYEAANARHNEEIAQLNFNPGPPTAAAVEGAMAALGGATVTVTRTAVAIHWTTEPITLSYSYDGPRGVDWGSGEITFGRFEVDLTFEGGNPFAQAHALEPCPCTWDETITHPHVRGLKVCLGEGQRPLRNAFLAGNLDLAKDIVTSILNTYSSDNPYARMSEWQGKRVVCSGCEEVVILAPGERGRQCTECNASLCTDCGHVCRCTRVTCSRHMYKCRECGVSGCFYCTKNCNHCGHRYCAGCLRRMPCCSSFICRGCMPTWPPRPEGVTAEDEELLDELESDEPDDE